MDAEYERQKEEADKQSADKKSRRIRKRKRDPDFVDDNESSDSFDSDDENGEDNLYALTPEVPKDNLFPNRKYYVYIFIKHPSILFAQAHVAHHDFSNPCYLFILQFFFLLNSFFQTSLKIQMITIQFYF